MKSSGTRILPERGVWLAYRPDPHSFNFGVVQLLSDEFTQPRQGRVRIVHQVFVADLLIIRA